MRPKQNAQQRKQTAYHEAGHAVIARVLTLPAGEATIEPDYEYGRGGRWGYAYTIEHSACEYEWEKRGVARESPEAALIARIISYMAGAEAEVELLKKEPKSVVGDGDDRLQIDLMMNELPRGSRLKEERLRKKTRWLVRRHKSLIERVANALLAQTTLTGEQIDKLIGRSVNDIVKLFEKRPDCRVKKPSWV